ncbi:uncharacterized protein LOC129574519 [Sitodiplosis mosellana]|uniref:uncharacterized protein LOC129574519 n=1 Tax=Sitodiplosis mosellana TaxID=263140 RepID=UPI002445225F|nr:uncharacterized protein LOC129574519 [Sitodiplosis mosellana]
MPSWRHVGFTIGYLSLILNFMAFFWLFDGSFHVIFLAVNVIASVSWLYGNHTYKSIFMLFPLVWSALFIGYVLCFFFATKIHNLYEIVSAVAIISVIFYILAILTYVYIIEYIPNTRTIQADEMPMRTQVLYEAPRMNPQRTGKMVDFELP